ncbi:thioesterase, partial [Mycobacterium sp. ITM-2017-0098]
MIAEQGQRNHRPWIKSFPGERASGRPLEQPATILFPHAGGAAAAYRKFAVALAACGVDTYIVQYPRRGDRLADPAPATLADLAA